MLKIISMKPMCGPSIILEWISTNLKRHIQVRHVLQLLDRGGLIVVLVEAEHHRLDDAQSVLKPDVDVDA